MEDADEDGARWPTVVAGALFVVLGVWRLFQGLSLAGVPATPSFVLLALVGEGVSALVAGLAMFAARERIAVGALVAFVAFVAFQMALDAFVHGIRSVVEAVAGLALAVVLALVGWLALRRRPAPTRAM